MCVHPFGNSLSLVVAIIDKDDVFTEIRDCDPRVLGFVNRNLYVNDGLVHVLVSYAEEDEALEILFQSTLYTNYT